MSTAQGYSGIDSFAFFIDEIAGYGRGGAGGTLLVPAAPDAQDLHIPLNSLTDLSFDLPKYTMYEEVFLGSSLPSRQAKIVEAGSMSLSTVYHAPFLASRFFTSTTTDGAWSANPETITLGMTNWETTTNSIAMHVHVDNRKGSADLDLNIFGGVITSYGWEMATGEVLKENVELSFNQFDESAIAFNAATDYHNQRFALWNTDRIIASTKVLAVTQQKVTVTTTTNLDAAIATYTNAKIDIKGERVSDTGLGYEVMNFNEKKSYDVEASLTVKPSSNYSFTQFKLRFENREVVNFKMQAGGTTTTEYILCTDMRLYEIGSVSIPSPSGDAVMQLELQFRPTETSVVTFVGAYDGTSTVNPFVDGGIGYIKGI